MKKVITILILLPLFLSAKLDTSKVNSLLSNIKSTKDSSVEIKFYNTENSLKIKDGLLSKSKNSADIIIFPKQKKINKAYIINSYSELKKYKNSIGAIYLKKGRTQIVFVEERLKKKGFKLTDKYKKYIIRECKLEAICLILN